MDRCMDGWILRDMGGWIDGWMNKWVDRWMALMGSMNRQMDVRQVDRVMSSNYRVGEQASIRTRELEDEGKEADCIRCRELQVHLLTANEGRYVG